MAKLGPPLMTLADQLMFSAGNFLFVVLVVRNLSAAEFADFAIGWLLLILAQNLQQTAVSSPAMIAGRYFHDRSTAKLGQLFLEMSIVLAGLLALVFAALMAAWLYWAHSAVASAPVISLLLATVATVAHDHARRRCFIIGARSRALAMDTVRTAGLVGLSASPLIVSDASAAFLAFTGTSLLAALVGGYDVRWRAVRPAIRPRAWKWVRTTSASMGGMALTEFIALNFPYFILATFHPDQFSAIRALASFGIALSNFPRAADNFLPLVLTRLVRDRRFAELRRLVAAFVAFGVVVHLVALALSLKYHQALIAFLFSGKYLSMSSYLSVILVISLTLYLFISFKNVLMAVGNAPAIFVSRMACCILSVGLAFALTPAFGATGMFAALIVADIASIAICVGYIRAASDRSRTPPRTFFTIG